ncbi:hypothetical protein T12_7563 [Trichinella patagoniensis]|uniref:Secreted protein n=1 Tax=Trichinella patagoniensis TaxID=990121 RepID=A0A0V1A1T0_9BILA|nr:hypothetical protein T12_7563 [Trichinella patagoniensis]
MVAYLVSIFTFTTFSILLSRDVIARACKSRLDNRINRPRNVAGALWPGSWQNSADKHGGRLNASQLPRTGQILDQRCWQQPGSLSSLCLVHLWRSVRRSNCPIRTDAYLILVKSWLRRRPD